MLQKNIMSFKLQPIKFSDNYLTVPQGPLLI